MNMEIASTSCITRTHTHTPQSQNEDVSIPLNIHFILRNVVVEAEHNEPPQVMM